MNEIVDIVRRGDRDHAAEILDSEPSLVNCTDKTSQNRTLLHIAVYRKDVEMVALLLAAGANPNKQDHAGASPILDAASRGLVRASQIS